MTSGVKVEILESQLLTPMHLIGKSGSGFLQSVRFRMSEVDEVAVMGQDPVRCVAGGITVLLKTADGGLRQRFGHPLALVFGKQGKGGGLDGPGIEGGVFHAAGGTDMGADIFHG